MAEFERGGLDAWMEDWKKTFAQDWTEDRLEAFVGKTVVAEQPASEGIQARGFKGTIVGYAHFVLGVDEDEGCVVHRWDLLTIEGAGCALYAGMEVTVVPEAT